MRSKTRRQFLRLGALGATASLSKIGMMNALAQQSGDYKALVCVFLFGGNDGDNTVVPIGGAAGADYTAERGALAVDASLHPIGSATHPTYGSATWGLHPSLAGLHALAQQDRLATLANVGTLVEPMTKADYQARSVPLPTRLFSHSDQQGQMQSGRPIAPSSSGWAGRLADLMAPLNAPSIFPTGVSLSGSALMVAGDQTQPATLNPGYRLSLLGSGTSARQIARDQAVQELLDFDTGFALVQRANHTLSDALEVGRLIESALASSGPLATSFPTSSLGRQLEEVAKLIKVRGALGMSRQVFFVSRGGFDTHSNQLAAHAGMLADVDASISAFYQEMQAQTTDQDVTVFTESDFGRTFQTNSNAGTDHAWGQCCFVLGGSVNGGLYGQFPTLQKNGPDSTDGRGRWIPTTALDQMGATMARWFGVAEADLPTVFPNIGNFPSSDMGFML